MPAKARIKADAVAHWVPADRDETNAAIAELGRLHRDRQRLQASMNDKMADVKARYDALAKPMGDRISELAKGVQLFCEANREKLTNGGRVKFHDFATGQVKWRLTPFSVAITKVGDVLALLRAKGQERFIRTKEEIDKDALLAAREELGEGIKGVAFKQKEEFAIVPNESKIEEVQS